MIKVTIMQGDVLERLAELPDNSVHCCVTSPPYWALRDYGVEGQIGLEPTIEEYIAKMVEVFREVRRMLRADGVCFLNLGDSFYGGGGAHKESHANPGISKSAERNGVPKGRGERNPGKACTYINGPNRKYQNSLKPKDLCGIPWRVALALQSDGWWLRSDIIWAKPNPMPESVTDRPTTSHEHIFLLTKSSRYFWDADAVKENGSNNSHGGAPLYGGGPKQEVLGQQQGGVLGIPAKANGRNLRSVWTIATAPFPQAHFATYPPELVCRCVAAGTSERGCCPKCGAPWVRVVEKEGAVKNGNYENQKVNFTQSGGKTSSTLSAIPATSITTGWTSTCTCSKYGYEFDGAYPLDPIPCTVLDPFSGAGTTALVAAKLGRDAIGIELSPAYVTMSVQRIKRELGMLAEIEVIAQEQAS